MKYKKAFDSIQHPFMRETFNKIGEENYLNMLKAMYEKPTVNIILNGEKTESLSFKFRTKSRMTTFTASIQLGIGSSRQSN